MIPSPPIDRALRPTREPEKGEAGPAPVVEELVPACHAFTIMANRIRTAAHGAPILMVYQGISGGDG